MTMSTPTIRSRRFILRELQRSDAAALFPTFADPASMRWWSRAPFDSEAELADWLVPESGWDEGRSWAIVEHGADQALGRIAVMDRGDDVAELGYLVVHTRHREGIAHEALGVLIDHLFRSEQKRRLFADVDPENTGSNRLLAALGFTNEGRLREHWTTHIGRRDSLIWGLLASEWKGADAPSPAG
jgi:RimJ/RimL family protein N-acetyltransferase